MAEPRTITTVLFDGFELLDACGPLELFGGLPEEFRLVLAGPGLAPVASRQGPALRPDTDYTSAPPPDIVLVPGGFGTRSLIADRDFLDWLTLWAGQAEMVTSVCTGSAVLAAAGLLDGYRATSNKRAFGWVREQGPRVDWVPHARWVADRDRWTSSGVAAGMDMALALIASLHGHDTAQTLADRVELEWHSDPDWDPFAGLYGLD
jgi:transcriptional regulator GlxA family with amidase domain